MTRLIPLKNGGSAVVDDEDYERLREHPWRAERKDGKRVIYAVADGPDGELLRLHRMVLDVTDDVLVDHRNGDGLDCRRSNLRGATYSQNGANRDAPANNATGFKGVTHKPTLLKKPWIANIGVDRKLLHLGYYATPFAAARAYDRAAVAHFGEFARLNFAAGRDWLFPHEHAGAWPPAR